MQLPSGFPVKIEIPIYHILNARITFGNIFALDSPVAHVATLQEDDGRLSCVLGDDIFLCPQGYTNLGNGNVDDRSLFFSIFSSLRFVAFF